MKCTEAAERITALVDGELPPAEREELERHLAGCPACREARAAEEDVAARLRAMPRPALPPGFAAGVMAKVGRGAGAPPNRVFPLWAFVAAGSAVAAAVLAMVVVGPGDRGSPPRGMATAAAPQEKAAESGAPPAGGPAAGPVSGPGRDGAGGAGRGAPKAPDTARLAEEAKEGRADEAGDGPAEAGEEKPSGTGAAMKGERPGPPDTGAGGAGGGSGPPPAEAAPAAGGFADRSAPTPALPVPPGAPLRDEGRSGRDAPEEDPAGGKKADRGPEVRDGEGAAPADALVSGGDAKKSGKEREDDAGKAPAGLASRATAEAPARRVALFYRVSALTEAQQEVDKVLFAQKSMTLQRGTWQAASELDTALGRLRRAVERAGGGRKSPATGLPEDRVVEVRVKAPDLERLRGELARSAILRETHVNVIEGLGEKIPEDVLAAVQDALRDGTLAGRGAAAKSAEVPPPAAGKGAAPAEEAREPGEPVPPPMPTPEQLRRLAEAPPASREGRVAGLEGAGEVVVEIHLLVAPSSK